MMFKVNNKITKKKLKWLKFYNENKIQDEL